MADLTLCASRLVLLCTALALSSCGLVYRSDTDSFGVHRDQLTAWIEQTESARASGLEIEAWRSALPADGLDVRGDTWDSALAELYARRSTATVQHERYPGFGLLCLKGCAEAQLGGILLFPVAIAIEAVELGVVVPLWFVPAAVRDWSVPEAELTRAATDLAHARSLGWTDVDERHTGTYLWPHPRRLYIDQLGYDVAWLASQEANHAPSQLSAEAAADQ